MTDKQTNFQKNPAKSVTTQDGATVKLKRLNPDLPSGIVHFPLKGGYQELYPSVYSIEIPNEGFIKIWDFFTSEYLDKRTLINYDQWCLYNFIGTLRNRGYYVTLQGKKGDDNEIKGLAKIIGTRTKTLIENLDHLENCLLMHRVRRLDLNGTPNEFILHTPFTAKQLDAENGKLHKKIVERVALNHVKKQRSLAVKTGEGKKGGFGYLDRKATNERFQFDYRFIKSSFGSSSRLFTDFALVFFKANLKLLRNNKSNFDYVYRAELSRRMSDWGIGGNSAQHQCYIAANKFRVIYCPTDEELYA